MIEWQDKVAGHCPRCVGKVSNLHRGAPTNLCHLVISGLCTFLVRIVNNSYHHHQ